MRDDVVREYVEPDYVHALATNQVAEAVKFIDLLTRVEEGSDSVRQETKKELLALLREILPAAIKRLSSKAFQKEGYPVVNNLKAALAKLKDEDLDGQIGSFKAEIQAVLEAQLLRDIAQ